MKENLRSFIKINIDIITRLNKEKKRILFSEFNSTMIFPILNAMKNHCNVFFLPKSLLNIRSLYEWDKESFYDYTDEITIFCDFARQYLEKNEIDYFVIDRLSRNSLYLHSFMIAAKKTGVKTIYLEHGHTGSYHPDLVLKMISSFDYFYCQDDSMWRYLNEECQKSREKIKILRWNENIFRKDKKINNNGFIVYAPSIMASINRFGRLVFETSKYRQKKIIIENLLPYGNIIYKIFPQSDDQYDAIPDWLIDKKFKNIKVIRDKTLIKWIRKAKLFITDAVSTPLYHAIEMGVPSFCLVYDRAVSTRKDVKDKWKNIIFEFSNENTLKELFSGPLKELISRPSPLIGKPIINTRVDNFPWEEEMNYEKDNKFLSDV